MASPCTTLKGGSVPKGGRSSARIGFAVGLPTTRATRSEIPPPPRPVFGKYPPPPWAIPGPRARVGETPEGPEKGPKNTAQQPDRPPGRCILPAYRFASGFSAFVPRTKVVVIRTPAKNGALDGRRATLDPELSKKKRGPRDSHRDLQEDPTRTPFDLPIQIPNRYDVTRRKASLFGWDFLLPPTD